MSSDRKKTITLMVNGEERIITAVPDSPLLDAIRDDMRESSVQLRCGEGRCGGCVVLLDGKRVLSCDIPISLADKRSITII
jgi:aerobic-type carbon monoxide dehydrogenase small subunit (CoxS/CutS family)